MIYESLDYLEKAKQKKDKYKNWHDWFAWYPVRINRRTKVWLQPVKRRLGYYNDDDPRFYGWEYKLCSED